MFGLNDASFPLPLVAKSHKGNLHPWNLEPWNSSTLECWNLLSLEPWNQETLEHLEANPGSPTIPASLPRNRGTVEPWNCATLSQFQQFQGRTVSKS